ncbi:MAG: diacylglycerol kinase [Candidatus Parcubacteria bacterium]|nr:diacylglycerol kinase [Candidatus Parcubacteria bacterium]
MIFNFRKLIKSFKVAFTGLWIGVKEENTIRIGVVIAFFVILFMFFFPLTHQERAIIVLCVFLVLSIELMNTQVERVTNLIDKNHNEEIKKIKDLAAGAVLMAIIGTAIVGIFIFTPYVIEFFSCPGNL